MSEPTRSCLEDCMSAGSFEKSEAVVAPVPPVLYVAAALGLESFPQPGASNPIRTAMAAPTAAEVRGPPWCTGGTLHERDGQRALWSSRRADPGSLLGRSRFVEVPVALPAGDDAAVLLGLGSAPVHQSAPELAV